MDFKVTIHRLLLREEKLELAVSASGPWDEKVRDPKMTIIFNNGDQTRRLPIVVRFYQSEKDGSFYLMASYSYMLNYLFYKQPKNKHIEFSLELSYGHTVLESVPFTVDPEDEKALELLVRETAVGVEESEQERQTYIEYEWDFPRIPAVSFWMPSRDRKRYSSRIRADRFLMRLLCGCGILCCFVFRWY